MSHSSFRSKQVQTIRPTELPQSLSTTDGEHGVARHEFVELPLYAMFHAPSTPQGSSAECIGTKNSVYIDLAGPQAVDLSPPEYTSGARRAFALENHRVFIAERRCEPSGRARGRLNPQPAYRDGTRGFKGDVEFHGNARLDGADFNEDQSLNSEFSLSGVHLRRRFPAVLRKNPGPAYWKKHGQSS